jgi:protein-tyrosine phosphatase
MHPDSALVLRGFGADAGDFRAQQLRETHAADADLTLTMTRAYRHEVLRLAPRALARTFTLREAAQLVELIDEDVVRAADAPAGRARALVRAMAEARAGRAASDGDDVADPIGRPVEAHEEAGEVIVEGLLPVLARIAALHGPDDTASVRAEG